MELLGDKQLVEVYYMSLIVVLLRDNIPEESCQSTLGMSVER